jgi:activator of 2-hydroxyglutaryl-CoA dehydratase
VKDFRLSNQCSAGNGMLLQAMADQFGVPLVEYAEVAFKAPGAEVQLRLRGVPRRRPRELPEGGLQLAEMLAGLAQVLPKNVWQYVVQVPRLAELGRVFVLQGGTQRTWPR